MSDTPERTRSTELPPSEQGKPPARRSRKQGLANRERARLAATALIAALLAIFALLNFDKVEVNWIVTSGRAPLIIVIALAFIAGVAFDRLLRLAARRRRAK